MSIPLNDLRNYLKDLLLEKKILESKIASLETLIDAERTKRPGSKEPTTEGSGFDFEAVARQIFTEQNNDPMKSIDLAREIMKRVPGTTLKQLKSKIIYAARINMLQKVGYGQYCFRGLVIDPNNKTTP